MRKYHLLIYTILVILILATCSNAAPAPVVNTPLPTTTTKVPKVTAAAPTITPAASTPPVPLTLNVEELVGFWRDIDGYIEFKPDETWAFATTLNALQAGTFYAQGTFSIEEDELTILDDICGKLIGVYRLETKTENKLTFIQVKEECVGRRRLPFLERIP